MYESAVTDGVSAPNVSRACTLTQLAAPRANPCQGLRSSLIQTACRERNVCPRLLVAGEMLCLPGPENWEAIDTGDLCINGTTLHVQQEGGQVFCLGLLEFLFAPAKS